MDAGYRVGIVRQTETAALKAVGSNRGKPFTRALTQMVTKGTMVDEMMTEHHASYLMCLVEEKRGGNGPDDRVWIGMVAVQLSTGDIIYDAFEDTFMRNELETRLLHLEPNEILIPAQHLSKPTNKIVQHVTTQGSTRIEKMPEHDRFCSDAKEALSFVSDFYESQNLQTITQLPDIIM